jgi:putative (di)nucleoside polyphosphate hydrolase
VIDFDGFRPNVGIVVSDDDGRLLWAKRCGEQAWQFPQGGIRRGETPEQALYRELEEELGLQPDHVEVLAVTSGWLRYRLPPQFIRRGQRPLCIGQKQKWFLLRLRASEDRVRFDLGPRPEFDAWRWVDLSVPIDEVVAFKRTVYRKALTQFAPLLGRARVVDDLA